MASLSAPDPVAAFDAADLAIQQRVVDSLALVASTRLGSTARPSEVQAWVKELSAGSTKQKALAASTVGVIHGIVAAVFKAAVLDRKVMSSPCVGTKLPKVEPQQVVPLTTAAVPALTDALPARYKALAVLAAGTGLRQGEAFGLTVDRVDFFRRTLTVDRQLVLLPGQKPEHGPPKTRASYRAIPLPQVVVQALVQHLKDYPAGTDGLIVTDDGGLPLSRTTFSRDVWRPAAEQAEQVGVTCHDLRDYYASLLIQHGESVKVVQARPRDSRGDAGHLQPSVARLGGPDKGRDRLRARSSCGLPAD